MGGGEPSSAHEDMNILLTKNNSLPSRIIRWLTKEDASHIAIESHGLVVHANFLGVVVSSKESFEDISTIVESSHIDTSPDKLLRFIGEYVGTGKYDFGGLLYCGLRIFLRLFGIRIPKKNLWQMTGMFMCTELVSLYVYDHEDSELTPRQLYDKIWEEHLK